MGRWKMAMFAGALFILAGLIDIFGGLLRGSHRAGSFGVSFMFLCLGLLWICIGFRFKKQTHQE